MYPSCTDDLRSWSIFREEVGFKVFRLESTFYGLHNGTPLLLSEGLICPYEMYNGNGTSLIPFYTRDITTISNCRQQCDSLQICQAYTFAAGICKLYQTAPTDPTITAAAGSTLNIKKCIYPDGRVIIVHLKYKLLQPIKLDTCKHE